MNDPPGVAVDAQGRILVADQSNRPVERFTVAGDGTVGFDRAFGNGVDTGGGPGFENCTTASGCQIGHGSDAAGGMSYPQGVAVDAQDRILVGDTNNYRVDRFTVAGDGTVGFDRSFGIDVDPGRRHRRLRELHHRQRLPVRQLPERRRRRHRRSAAARRRCAGPDPRRHADSDRIERFAVAGDGTVGFDRAFGIDVDPSDGDTGDFENCTTASGCQFGTKAAPPADGGPSGVAVDAQGRILVADTGNDWVARFSPGPTVTVTKVLAPTTDPGTFDLRVDAVVVRAAAANGESGALQVADGVDVTISEQAVSGQLSDYDTAIDCGGGPQAGTSLTLTNVTANVNCTITNTRRAAAPPPGGPGPGGGPGTRIGRTGDRHDRAGFRVRVAHQHDVRRRSERRRRDPGERPRKKGTVFRYSLSEDARVVFTIKRATVGRSVGGSVAGRRARTGRVAAAPVTCAQGRFARQSVKGANRHRFSGRIGQRSLRPGEYRATLVATDAAGNRSAPRRLKFEVVKRR